MEPRITLITLGVSDLERSYRFYKEVLNLPTEDSPEKGIIFFHLDGIKLSLYPIDKLAEDVWPELKVKEDERRKFSGITLAHNLETRDEVDQLLKQAEQAGAKIEKKAQKVFWGGYSGYFSDPDGHLWEVACSNNE
jgi:catechol 2,3-dioxygenase-like lactoylglutathione lyase family enzyme